MKTDARFFITFPSVLRRMRNISSKAVEEIEANTLRSINVLPRKPCCLCDNVYKCGTIGQATEDRRCMRIARWIPTAANTHSQYGNNGYSNAPQCYVIRT